LYSSDATAWCAITVNDVLAECGYPTTASVLAKSFVNDAYGLEIAPADIAPVDIIVFDRGNVAWQGHVEVVDKVSGDGTVWAIGGNVSDQVKRSLRKIADIVPRGNRRPVMAAD